MKLTKRLHLIHWLCNLYLFHAYIIETKRIPLCARYIYIIMHQFKMSSHVMTSILFYTRWFCYQNGTTRIVSSSVCYSARWSAGFSHHQHYNWMVKFSCGPCCPARCGHCRLPPWRSPQLQFWWHSHMDNQLGECHPKAGRLTYLCFFYFALFFAVMVVQKRYNICSWNGALCYGYLDSNVSGKFISHYLFDVLVQC